CGIRPGAARGRWRTRRTARRRAAPPSPGRATCRACSTAAAGRGRRSDARAETASRGRSRSCSYGLLDALEVVGPLRDDGLLVEVVLDGRRLRVRPLEGLRVPGVGRGLLLAEQRG